MLDRLTSTGPLARLLADYVADTLHATVDLEPWRGGRSLPAFLASRYRFYMTQIVGKPVLFMAITNSGETNPADIAKHVRLVAPAFDGIVVFATSHMSATIRARLIKQGVAFVVPKNQLYIPQLVLDLRDYFRASTAKSAAARLSPAAQLVLFHHILRRDATAMTPSQLAEPLEFAAMSIGRAFDQLASFDLVTVEWRGRQKVVQFKAEGRDLLELSQPFLRSPVRGRHGVRFQASLPRLLRAGETALAYLSELKQPTKPTYAILATGWHTYFQKHHIQDVNEIDEADAFIETWLYDPRRLSKTNVADPLSLYAQFRNNPDERVAQAARQLLEQVQW